MVPLAFQTAVDIINKLFPNEIASENSNLLSKEPFSPGCSQRAISAPVINWKEEKQRAGEPALGISWTGGEPAHMGDKTSLKNK